MQERVEIIYREDIRRSIQNRGPRKAKWYREPEGTAIVREKNLPILVQNEGCLHPRVIPLLKFSENESALLTPEYSPQTRVQQTGQI
jgi:hypothetical protein